MEYGVLLEFMHRPELKVGFMGSVCYIRAIFTLQTAGIE